MALARGSLWIYLLYDVADEIDLVSLRSLLGVEPPRREPSFKHPAPEYVRFENPPVAQPIALPERAGIGAARGRLKYYDYGVVSLELELPFEAAFDDVVALAGRWMGSPDLERWAADTVRRHLDGVAADALKDRYQRFLAEDYYVVEIREALNSEGVPYTAEQLIAVHGSGIARIVRGETSELSPAEQQEVLASRLSYYPTDLLVAAWSGALVYDANPGVESVLQILEYANSQLLEFRHYDEVLTRVLAGVHRSLQKRAGFWSRWKRVREAERLNALRLEIVELTERADNSIKFLSDMYYARAYRLAADKVGVADYRRLVDAKLLAARDWYDFIVSEFHHSRAFVLELMVVIILIIDLIALFTGKPT